MLRRAQLCHSMSVRDVQVTSLVQVPRLHRPTIRWNTSKIISRLKLKVYARDDNNMSNLVQREHPKIRVEYWWGHEHKNLQSQQYL